MSSGNGVRTGKAERLHHINSPKANTTTGEKKRGIESAGARKPEADEGCPWLPALEDDEVGADGAVEIERVLVAITVSVVVGSVAAAVVDVKTVLDVVLGVDETLLLLLLELADELGLDDGNALEPELELALADVPEDDAAKALEEELAGAPTMDVDVAEVVCDSVMVEGTGIAAVSLATGEPKEPVMESSVNMVEN